LTSNQWYAIISLRAAPAHFFNKMTSYQSQKPSFLAPVVSVLFAALFSGAAFYCLTSSLDQLTQRDCNAGIQKACEALR